MNTKTPILLLALALVASCNMAQVRDQASRTKARCAAPVDHDGIHWSKTICWAQSR